jgi:hypothetical protein
VPYGEVGRVARPAEAFEDLEDDPIPVTAVFHVAAGQLITGGPAVLGLAMQASAPAALVQRSMVTRLQRSQITREHAVDVCPRPSLPALGRGHRPRATGWLVSENLVVR